jgi:ribosomal protein S20
MADNELDRTIEELEAEVLAELEEANGQDAPKKSGAPADKMDKADGEVQDMGKAVVDPEQKDAPAKKVVAKAKEVSGEKSQKGEGKPEKMDKPKAKDDGTGATSKSLAAGDEVDHDGEVIAEKEVSAEKKLTKTQMSEVISKGMPKMNKAQLEKLYAAMHNNDDEEEEENEMDEVKKEAIENRVKEIDVAEHVEALVNGEGDLSEEFKRKAATVFEAAVKSKIRTEIERLESEYEVKLKENVHSATDEMTDKVDTYLNYVTDEWMKENELAVERGLKGEIAEDFISGLKQLFEDHYIDIPDEKYDVLEAQSEKISELEGKISETIEKNVSLKDGNAKLVREQVISEVYEGLADTEIEKFKSLTDDVEYTDEESFREKLDTLKESYFPKTSVETTENIDDVETGTAQDIDLTPSMDAYMSAIGRTVK